MSDAIARYPYEAPVTAYGNGGFRFAEMSHRGSILCLPTGIYAWSVTAADLVREEDFALVIANLAAPATVLFGTGMSQIWPSDAIERLFANAGLGLETMSTGAAARTYNVLLAEKRRVAAALIAVP